MKVIWTVHNLAHHEGADFIDRLGYRLLARHSDLLIFHCRRALQGFHRQNWARGVTAQTVVMDHGNYDGVYPEPRAALTVREELGLDTARAVACCVGQIRPYKGVETAVEAVRRTNDVQLLVAGKVHEQLRPQLAAWQRELRSRLNVVNHKN